MLVMVFPCSNQNLSVFSVAGFDAPFLSPSVCLLSGSGSDGRPLLFASPRKFDGRFPLPYVFLLFHPPVSVWAVFLPPFIYIHTTVLLPHSYIHRLPAPFCFPPEI